MTEAVLGLFESQHRELGMIAKDWRVSQKAQPGVSGKNPDRYRGIARVMAQGPDPLTYQPKTERTCWLFEYSKTQPVKTVDLSGDSLEGDLVLTINGAEIHVDCQANTAELRAALVAAGITANDCRANAFPGLWEFDFTGGRWDSAVPSFTCVAYEPPEDDTETPVYSGELSIVDEAWVSVADGDEVATIDTTDWIPFAEGAIVSGAVGSAMWHYQAGWIVTAWQCRAWSFASAGSPYGGA
jgi:hypothetical protein